MDNTAFNNLLKKNRVDGVLWTHVSLFRPKGKYQMDRRSMETFWKHLFMLMVPCYHARANEQAVGSGHHEG